MAFPRPFVRLEPQSLAPLPAILFSQAEQLTAGRSTSAACVTRFVPRNPKNDARTMMLSREHLILTCEAGELIARDAPGANHSYMAGQPADAWPLHHAQHRLTMAGEYDLELRVLPSAWPMGKVWRSQPPPPQAGCLVVHPLYPAGVIDFRTVWLFSDVLFGVRSDGLLLFGPDPSEAVGWFLAAAGHVAVLAADDSGRTAHNGRPLSAGIPVILATGDTLLTDSLEWAVEIS